MAEKTGIAWTDSTFNPWVSCTKVSPACDNCYAEKWGARFGYKWGPGQPRHRTSASTWRQPLVWNRKAKNAIDAWEQFKATQPGLTDAQLEAQGFHKPTRPRVFCGSLCDVFDNEVPEQWRYDLFQLIARTPYLSWLLLTKRIGNARAMIADASEIVEYRDASVPEWTTARPWPNVWIGATICNQEEADRDIPKLLAVPVAKRFLSIEPMLGEITLDSIERLSNGNGWFSPLISHVDLDKSALPTLDWIIVGGETGKHARPMHPAWVRSLRDQCVAAGVPYFFKQWGEWHPQVWTEGGDVVIGNDDGYKTDAATGMVRVGHKAAGNTLDGRTWTEGPA